MFILFKIHRLATSALCLTLLFTSQTAFAQKTIWEIGAGISGLTAPHYPGTTSKKNYLIPYPYLTLETDVITIDKGIQAYLFKTEDVRFDVTLDFGLPVNSDESRLRTGMPKLNTVIQFGPSLEITLQGGKKKPSELRLEFPVRTAIATDIKHSENIGWIFEPGISYEKNRLGINSWAYTVTAGLRYATQEYHAYYYDVAPQYVTAQRPAFYSDGGFNAYLLDGSATYRHNNMIFWVFGRYMNLKHSEYAHSPLVNDTDYFMLGAGVTWIIAGNKYNKNYLF